MLFLAYHESQMSKELIEQLRSLKQAVMQRVPVVADASNPSYRIQLFGSDEMGSRVFIDTAIDERASS